VTVEAWGEQFAPLQPNIFPKFLFHFADFPYKLCIHQPEPAQLGNLLRIAVRTGRKSILSTPTLGFSRDKRVDLKSRATGRFQKNKTSLRTSDYSSRINSIPKTTNAP